MNPSASEKYNVKIVDSEGQVWFSVPRTKITVALMNYFEGSPGSSTISKLEI